jgi:hypothetical protein
MKIQTQLFNNSHDSLVSSPLTAKNRPYGKYVDLRYRTISALSNIATPVLGSSKYGTWNVPPVRRISAVRRGLPRAVGRITYEISISLKASRTTAQNGDASYAHSSSGRAGATDGRE